MKTNLFASLYQTKPIQHYVKWAQTENKILKTPTNKVKTNYEFLQDAVPNLFMMYGLAAQCVFLQKSKEMPKERKVPLLFNNLYTAIIGVSSSLILRKPIKNLRLLMLERAKIIYKDNPNKNILINGIDTAVPFLVTALLFRYLGHVIATPLSTQTTDYFVKNGTIKMPENK